MMYKIIDNNYSIRRDSVIEALETFFDITITGNKVKFDHKRNVSQLFIYHSNEIKYSEYIRIKKFCMDNLPYMKEFTIYKNSIALNFVHNEKSMIIF